MGNSVRLRLQIGDVEDSPSSTDRLVTHPRSRGRSTRRRALEDGSSRDGRQSVAGHHLGDRWRRRSPRTARAALTTTVSSTGWISVGELRDDAAGSRWWPSAGRATRSDLALRACSSVNEARRSRWRSPPDRRRSCNSSIWRSENMFGSTRADAERADRDAVAQHGHRQAAAEPDALAHRRSEYSGSCRASRTIRDIAGHDGARGGRRSGRAASEDPAQGFRNPGLGARSPRCWTTLAVETEDDAERRPAQRRALRGDRVEHRLQIGRRARR